MLQYTKDASLTGVDIPFGVVEVGYPEPESWHEREFYALAESELAAVRAAFDPYERKAVFGENPYFRFFKKFKKTFPVVLQFESAVIKGAGIPGHNPVTDVPYLLELTFHVLSGTHDIDYISGDVELYISTDRTTFPGMRGFELHTYPGDFCARDGMGIIFSEIAGADDRTCARPESRRVFYPIFGTPGLPPEVIEQAINSLCRYVGVLAPEAAIESAVF